MKSLSSFILVFIFLFSTALTVHAKRSGFVLVKSIFKKPQNVANAAYTKDEENNSASLSLGGRRKFSSASIIVSLNNVLDNLIEGQEFTIANTGISEDLDVVHLNMLAAKYKNDSGFQYTTYEDNESTVRDVKIKVRKVDKKTGVILLSVKATFDNVRYVSLDENSDIVAEERFDDITVFGRIKFKP